MRTQLIPLELFNLLVNPLEKTYALSWHRDDIKPTVSASEESEALGIKHHGIQWNAALYDDACLSAVPGSHRRVRTPAEREANLSGGVMPGGKALELKKGETVFYNNNICEWFGAAWSGSEWLGRFRVGSIAGMGYLVP